MSDLADQPGARISRVGSPGAELCRRGLAPQAMPTLRTILVGLDGSPEGQMAVELGLRWARATGAGLVGLGIVDEPTIRRAEPVPLGAGSFKRERDDKRVEDARRRIEELLQDFARRCGEQDVASAVVERVGLPHEQIALEEERHDLVVLPRRSHFHLETERGPDDTVERVLRNSSRPVVTVPGQRWGSGPVVVAYHGGVHAARALQAFQALGIESEAEVVVISVHRDEAEAVERADGAMAFLASHGVLARRTTVADRGSAATSILRAADEMDARMLVAGRGGSHRVAELFSGSVTRTLLCDARMPVFLYS